MVIAIFSRVVSLILRVGQIGFGAVVAGVIGSYLRDFDSSNTWPKARWIYTEVVAGVAILFGVIWLVPFSFSFKIWPLDIIISLAWFAAFGLLVDSLKEQNCGDIFRWRGFVNGDMCGRWKAAEAFSFLSAIFWIVSALVGILFTFRARQNRRRTAEEAGRV